MRKFIAAFLSVFISAGTLVISPLTLAAIDNTPDNDSVAIIKGGVFSEAEVQAKAKQGDVPVVYKAFGIKQSQLNGFVDGVVWKDGRVTVGNDQVVAKNAKTAGRWDTPKSGMIKIPGTDRAYKMSTSNFTDEGQTAFIKMVNNKFSFAIIKPCGNPVTATPLAPPKPNLTIQKQVSTMQSSTWKESVTVKPGEHVKYRVIIKNTGKTVLDKLSMQEMPPTGITFVVGVNNTYDGTVFTTDLTGGVALGALNPGEQHTIVYEASTSASETRKSACSTGLVNKAIARSGNVVPDKSDTANVKVCAPNQTAPQYSCDSIVGNTGSNRSFGISKLNVTAQSGATFKRAVIHWGDGQSTNRSTEDEVSMHVYSKDATYNITVDAFFLINGKEVKSPIGGCTTSVTFEANQPPVVTTGTTPKEQTPTALVDTGTGAVIGGVFSTIIGGALAYRFVWLRRLV